MVNGERLMVNNCSFKIHSFIIIALQHYRIKAFIHSTFIQNSTFIHYKYDALIRHHLR